MKRKSIGIVGLGIMGRGMTENFLKHGYSVFAWNRTASIAEGFGTKGAHVCLSPKEVARKADIVFEITANDESSRHVWTSANGILSGASPDKIVIACATLSIGWIDELIATCTTRGIPFLDMAITGGRIGAESGTLTLLCGGKESLIDELKPTLAAIAKDTVYFGPAGQGMRYKLLLNFLQAVHIAGFGEAMAIAKAHGMDMKKVGDALAERPGGTATKLAWRDYQNEPEPINFSIEWITKDLTYARRFAENRTLPLLDEVLSKYEKAVKKGLSKKDWTTITADTS
jgi:3-hydroxyisobutyrate dehydrogenase